MSDCLSIYVFSASRGIFTRYSHKSQNIHAIFTRFPVHLSKDGEIISDRPGNAAAAEISSDSGSEDFLMRTALAYTGPAPRYSSTSCPTNWIMPVSTPSFAHAIHFRHFSGVFHTPMIVATSSTFSDYKGGPHGT